MVDRVAVVTGGGGGLGLAIAESLLRSGVRVAVLDRSSDAAESAVAGLGAQGLEAMPVTADVADREDVESAFARVGQELGEPNILINNAGISVDAGLRRITDDDWQRTLDVNLTGVMLCTQAATQRMVPQGFGRIINVSSRAWLGWMGQVSYSAAKGGVVSMTRSLAIELAKFGITANCIAPGLINTPMLQAEPPEVMERLLLAQPSRSIGSPEDVAWAVEFFAAESSSAVTGQVLYVCGGKSLMAMPAL